MDVEMKTVGFALYDSPPALKKFLEARASGKASKELLTQLSADAMAEQYEGRPLAPVIDFATAKRERK